MSCGIRQLRLQVNFSCASSKNKSKHQVQITLFSPHNTYGSTPLYSLSFVGMRTKIYLERISCSCLKRNQKTTWFTQQNNPTLLHHTTNKKSRELLHRSTKHEMAPVFSPSPNNRKGSPSTSLKALESCKNIPLHIERSLPW